MICPTCGKYNQLFNSTEGIRRLAELNNYTSICSNTIGNIGKLTMQRLGEVVLKGECANCDYYYLKQLIIKKGGQV